VSGNQSRSKGDKYERAVVNYLKQCGVFVERGKRGNKTGDVLGISRIVLECKDQKTFDLAGWVNQMLEEAHEARADFGVVIAKRPRKTDVAEHYFVMTVEDGLALLRKAGYVPD
jgi:Holliday junction resolvase